MATAPQTTSKLSDTVRQHARSAGSQAYDAVDAQLRRLFKAPTAEEEQRLRAAGAYDRPVEPAAAAPGQGRRRTTSAAGDTRERARDARGEDAPPDSPQDIPPRTWKFVLRRTLREFSDDQCTDLAAALTYYAVLSVFPGMIALVSVLGLVGQSREAVDTSLQILEDLGAGEMISGIEPTLTSLTQTSAAGWGVVVGLAGSLWSASGYVGAFGRTLNRIYETEEGRPVWKLRPAMLGLTALLLLMAALTLGALVVSGPLAEAVGNAIGLDDIVVTLWGILKWPVILAVVILMVALLYYLTPNVRQPRFRWVSVGAVVAIVIWVVGSALFGVYVGNFSSYDAVYGSVAGVIVFLLWLWLTNLALLFGAEIDAELERARQLESGVKAERVLQIEPRDDSGIEKKEEKFEADVAEGRRIRQAASS